MVYTGLNEDSCYVRVCNGLWLLNVCECVYFSATYIVNISIEDKHPSASYNLKEKEKNCGPHLIIFYALINYPCPFVARIFSSGCYSSLCGHFILSVNQNTGQLHLLVPFPP